MTTTAQPTALLAAAYGRISDDDLDKREGVNEQLDLGVSRIRRQPDWTLVGTFRDDDISAYSGKPRPGYDALMAEVVAGRVTIIVVRHLDRLWRDDLEAAQARRLLKKYRVTVVEYRGASYEMWTAAGQHMARSMGSNAIYESDVKSERVSEAAERRARQGRMNGACLYGWRREYERTPSGRVLDSYEVEDPEAADVVREITRRLLAGESLVAVTDSLNRRGIRPPGADMRLRKKNRAPGNVDGSQWSKTSVRQVALRAANAGFRVFHKGEPDEKLIPAAWPALVSEDDWRAVVALQGAASAAQQSYRRGARAHLLTYGIGYCGVCGAVLGVAPRGTKGNRKPTYCCTKAACVGRNVEALDRYVGYWVVERLSLPDAVGVWVQDGTALVEAQAEATRLAGQLRAAASKVVSGEWTMEFADAFNAQMGAKLREAQQKVDRLQPSTGGEKLLRDTAGPEAAGRWAAMGVAQRRLLLDTMRLRVTVLPSSRRGPGFRTEDVRIERV